jgi:hypothetical protein
VTPVEALAFVRQFGTVEPSGGVLKVRVPKSRLAALEPALEVLRNAKKEVLSVLAKSATKAQPRQVERPEPTGQELNAATALLNRPGARIMRLETGDAIGIWSDLDSAAIRRALRILAMGELPIRYLDGSGIPLRYKLRRVDGDPVPDYVRREMEQSLEPWKVRDQLLGPAWRFVPWPAPPAEKTHSIDPRTGIRPIDQWGTSCGRGFVSNPRFGPNQPVIPRTNRATTRKWRALDSRRNGSTDA